MSYGGVDNCIEASLNLQEDALKLHKEKTSRYNNNLDIYCLECGEVIPPLRRYVIPNADYCIECAAVNELKMKTRAAFKFRDIYCP